MSNELYKALFKLQGEIRGVKRDSKNPHFKNSYASLEAVTDTIRPHMQECGLMWFQSPGLIVDGSIEVTTEIIHAETGQSKSFVMQMPLGKRDPQGAGSSLTYAMRYSLMAALGLPPTDDDAEVAIDREEARPAPEAPKPKSSAQLKRERSWEQIVDDLERDMLDVKTQPQLEKLKVYYRELVTKEQWPAAWKYQLKDKLEGYENEIRAMQDRSVEDDIQDQFPGAKITNERMEAAE